jgi:methylenetetrahydrofolate dehydrogenase (NADP+)/methenyltetrahydrofolate cyclohydrolase
MATILDGKKLALKLRENLRLEVDKFKSKGQRLPGLAVVLVGSDPASQVYVRNKTRACEKAGMVHRQIDLPASVSQQDLITIVQELNEDSSIDGILVQLPLPKGLDEQEVIKTISPEKDVDGFHPENIGRLVLGQDAFIPCTPYGIIKMIETLEIDTSGKEMVIVGRSNIVGKPMALLGLQRGIDATVTVCHSRTIDLPAVVSRADIIVAAIGRAKFITADMVKPGAIVIDVGINRLEDGKLCGDVDFEAIEPICSAITPVPGGVGPMTIAMLISNTVESRKRKGN